MGGWAIYRGNRDSHDSWAGREDPPGGTRIVTSLPFPSNYSILVAGPPGVGKLEFLLGLARGFLDAGERITFVTLDLHPDEVRARALAAGLELSSAEGRELALVEWLSFSASARPEPH